MQLYTFYFICKLLYMFRVVSPPIIRNTNNSIYSIWYWSAVVGTAHLKRDGTRAETRFGLSAKRTSPFKLAGGVSSVDYWQQRCAHQQ